MKIIIYLSLLLISTSSFAQQNSEPNYRTQTLLEEVIWFTYYDLPWIGSSPTHIVNNSDGTISTCLNFSPTANFGYPDAEGYYVYFDGLNWIQDTNASAMRTLFPAIGVTPLFQEIMLMESDSGIIMKRRPVKGTGAWVYNTTSFGTPATHDSQARIATGGTNQQTVHALWCGGGNDTLPVFGQMYPILYSRSLDAGITWQVMRSLLPQLDAFHYKGFGPGNYSIDCRGNTVAIAYGNSKTDIGLLKSTDGGNTWTQTIVDSFPIPMFDDATMTTDTNSDGLADTLNSNGGDPYVLIDNFGICHVWYSRLKVVCSQPGTQAGEGLQIDPYSDGLYYWKDTWFPNFPVQIATAQDLTGNQRIDYNLDQTCSLPFGNYRGGLTQFPSAGVDLSDNLYVCYQTIAEFTDTTIWKQAHRHVYTISSTDHGQTWGIPVDVVPTSNAGGDGEFQEAAYPSMARISAFENPTILYQRDAAPGTSLAEPGTCDQINNNLNPSDFVVVKATVFAGVKNLKQDEIENVRVFPNPANSFLHFQFQNSSKENIKLELRNNLGQLMIEKLFKANTSEFALDISGIPSGVYTCSVEGDQLRTVKKIIVE